MDRHTKDKQFTAFDAWDALKRFRWRFIGPAFMAACVILVVAMFLPRKYRGDAVFERRTDMVLTEIMNRGVSGNYQDPRVTLVEELAGRPAIDQAIEDLKPLFEQNYSFFDKQAIGDELSKKVLVKRDIASDSVDRIRVSFIAQNPQVARQVVNTLVTNYITRTRKQLDDRLHQTEKFFSDEVERNRVLIEDLENKQVAFEIEHAQLLPDSPNGLPNEIVSLQDQIADATRRRDAAGMRIGTLQEALANTPRTVPVVTRARNPVLAQLEAQRRDAAKTLSLYVDQYKMTEKHPDVAALRQTVASLDEQIKNTDEEVVSQTSDQTNPKYADLEMQITTATADLRTVERELQGLTARKAELAKSSDELFPIRADYRKISRDVEKVQRQLAFWEDNLRRVRMAQTAELGNRGVQLEFIKPCDALRLPISPNVIQLLMLAVAAAFVAGVLGVFFAQRADQTFSEGEKLAESFDLPLLGSVSEIINSQQRRVRRLHNYVLFPGSAAVMAAVVVAMASVLYLNLEKPAVFAQIKNKSATMIGVNKQDPAAPASVTASPTPAPTGDKPQE
ncbi:MAG: hypothetical protein GC164_14465 [Phycisphaera sp.]|nr:hypothetical protein [Phycisphaera sp.]